MARTKILLDTDIGTDSDDTLCLAYLLRQPDCELVGVTTFGPDPEKRAEQVASVCDYYGQPDIPIAAGWGEPLLANVHCQNHRFNQQPVIDLRPTGRRFPARRAVPLLRDTILAHPGEVTLLTVGPLTNVAALIAAEPEAASRLKAIYTMGGRFQYPADAPQTECNIMLDPVAAGIVLHHAPCPVNVCSLEVTRGHAISGERFDEVFAPDHLEPIRVAAHCWTSVGQTGKPLRIGVHDPLTAASLFDDFLTWKRGRIGIKLRDHELSSGDPLPGSAVTGYVTFEPADDGPHRVAATVDAERFQRHLVDVLHGTG